MRSSRPLTDHTLPPQTLTFEGWPVEVERKAFRRSLTVTLSMNGPIKVKTSLLTSPAKIFDFLEKKRSWLKKHILNFEKLKHETPCPVLKHGELFPFQGREIKLTCVLTLNAKPFFSIHQDDLLLHIPKKLWTVNARQQIYPWSDLLGEFYEKQGRVWIEGKVKQWSVIMQLFPLKVKFRAPKTRWGSCSSQKVLNFNWKLIVFNSKAVDYVVIHELAHLQHLNHSKLFWDLVEKHCPDFVQWETELKNKHSHSSFLNN